MGPIFWVGCLLWVIAAVGALVVYQIRPQTAPLARTTPSAPAGPDAQTITLNPEGKTEISISDLLAGKYEKANESGSIWDPAGLNDFSFTNCDGRTITKQDLLGKPWAVATVFTHCIGPCPTVTRQMKQLQDELKGYDCHLVTLTVDPKRDTPEVLKKYALLNGADLEKWYFLTGNVDEIYGLIHNGFKLAVQEAVGPDVQPGYEVIHSVLVLLVDEHGVVQEKYNAAKPSEMVALRRELQRRSSFLPADARKPQNR